MKDMKKPDKEIKIAGEKMFVCHTHFCLLYYFFSSSLSLQLFSDFFLPLFLLQFFLPFLIAVQIEEGLLEDAESQIELLSVMHNAEELSPEFLFLKSQIVRLSNKRDLKSKRDINDYFHFYLKELLSTYSLEIKLSTAF